MGVFPLALLSLLISAECQLIVDSLPPSGGSYPDMYKKALDFYYKQDFPNTILYTELALVDKNYRDTMLLKCNDRCTSEGSVVNPQMFFLSLITREKCTKKCMKKLFGEPLQLSLTTIKAFKKRDPYNFLQYAYYKSGNLEAALESAIIHLKYNKDSEMMQQNVKFYGGRVKDFTWPLHEKPGSVDQFEKGLKAYNRHTYPESSVLLNQSLMLYTEELKKCKILCETGYDEYVGKKAPNLNDTQNFQDQFVKLYHKVMECRYSCVQKFDKAVDLQEDYLPALLNYLQFSSYQTKSTLLAAQCAAAYLQIFPGNQMMTTNMKFYTNKLGGEVTEMKLLTDLIAENDLDLEVLSAIVGKREMRKRLKDKQNFSLGDMGLVSELQPNKDVLWKNTY